MVCDKTDLMGKTREYWNFKGDSRSKLSWYLRELLPSEIECARENERWSDREKEGTRVLVLMLGYSPEPLLQSIVYYKPSIVLMVLNEKYLDETCGGVNYYEDNFEFAFDLLVENGEFIRRKPDIRPAKMETTKDDPIAVFRYLQKHLLPLMKTNGKRSDAEIIVDITGAKKSMVAGAYLFAAFAGTTISYVDFDLYDPKRGRPYGFSCKITLQESPIKSFRILDWERVREFYKNYAFLSANSLLEDMQAAMNEWFTSSDDRKEIEAIALLREVLQMYEYWNNGNYRKAWQKFSEDIRVRLNTPLRLPSAIEELGIGDSWPSGDTADELLDDLKKLEFNDATGESFFTNKRHLIIYACDELEKVKRLITLKEDGRSALLRSVGVREVLLKARLLILLEKGLVELAIQGAQGLSSEYRPWNDWDEETQEAKTTIFRRIIEQDSIYGIVSAVKYDAAGDSDDRKRHIKLSQKQNVPKEDKWDEDERVFRLRRSPLAKLLSEDVIPDSEKNLRNKAIHTTLSISIDIAWKAYNSSVRNFQDFEDKWATLLSDEKVQVTTSVFWSAVCESCRIDFLPPFSGEGQEDDDEISGRG